MAVKSRWIRNPSLEGNSIPVPGLYVGSLVMVLPRRSPRPSATLVPPLSRTSTVRDVSLYPMLTMSTRFSAGLRK